MLRASGWIYIQVKPTGKRAESMTDGAATAQFDGVGLGIESELNISSTEFGWIESNALWQRKRLRQRLREEPFLSVI